MLAALTRCQLALAIVLGGAAACAPAAPEAALRPTALSEAPGCPYRSGATLGAADLGFSLGRPLPHVPRGAPELRAYIARHTPDSVLVLRRAPDAEAGGDRRRAPDPEGGGDVWTLRGIAGGLPCPPPDDELRIEGAPPLAVVRARDAWLEERLAASRALLDAGRAPEARVALAALVAVADEPVVALRLVGDSYRRQGRPAEAAAAYARAAARAPWDVEARIAQGEALVEAGRSDEAMAPLREAVALRPGADALRARIATLLSAEVRPAVAPPAWRDGAGQWHVGPGSGALAESRRAEADAYAGCKEAFRVSPALRRDATGLDGAWRWSVAEEELCTRLWLDAYRTRRRRGRPVDPALEALLDLAAQGTLAERALYDVGGRAHPLAAAFLPPAWQADYRAFVARERLIDAPPRGWLAP